MIAQFNPSSRNILRRWPALMAAALLLCCGVLLADAADPAQGKPEAKPAPATGPFTPSIVSPPKPVAALTNSGGYTPVLIVPEVNNKAKSEALWLKLHASEIDLANKRGELDRLQTLREILPVGNYRNDKFGRSADGTCSRINVLIAKERIYSEEIWLRI